LKGKKGWGKLIEDVSSRDAAGCTAFLKRLFSAQNDAEKIKLRITGRIHDKRRQRFVMIESSPLFSDST
jgi:hypothetical protein